MITLVKNKNLGFVLKASERDRVQNPVAIALKRRPGLAFFLTIKTPTRFMGLGSKISERCRKSDRHKKSKHETERMLSRKACPLHRFS